MKKLVLVGMLLLGFSIMAVAQDTPAVEIFGGYSYVRADTTTAFGAPSGLIDLNMNGWNANVAFNGNKWLGLVADFGGIYGAVEGEVEDVSAYTVMFGPRVSIRKGKVTPFVQGLFGYARLTAEADEVDVFTENDFAMAFGGGVDINVNDMVAVRPLQVEYFTTKTGTTGDFADHLRYSAGFVLKLGKR